MKFIAYTFKGRKEIRSAAHDTREAAAQELFTADAKLHRVETAVAVQTAEGTLVTFGKDIRSVSRLEAAKALKQTPTTEPTLKDARPGRSLVIHVNAFTRKLTDGYWRVDGKMTARLTRAEVCFYLQTEADTQVEFLSV